MTKAFMATPTAFFVARFTGGKGVWLGVEENPCTFALSAPGLP